MGRSNGGRVPARVLLTVASALALGGFVAPRAAEAAKPSLRRFGTALELVLGRAFRGDEERWLFEALQTAGDDDSAVEFQRYADRAREAEAKGPDAVAALREAARAELRVRSRDGGDREPWPTVRRILGGAGAAPTPPAATPPARSRRPAGSRPPARAAGGPAGPPSLRPAQTAVPAALVGTWQLGSGHVDIAGIESGRLQAAGGSLERLVVHPDGRYEHTLVMRQPNHTIATHATGVVQVAGPRLQLVALSTRGFQQYGRKRTPIGAPRRKATQHHWTIRPGRVQYLVLDGKRLLARIR